MDNQLIVSSTSESILTRAYQRASKYRTVPIADMILIPSSRIQNGFLGSLSITDIDTNTKYKVTNTIILNAEGSLISYSDLLNAHLDHALEEIQRRKLPFLPRSREYLNILPPRACNPGHYADCVYADIRSAYSNIYSVVGLDTQLDLDYPYLAQGAIRPTPTSWPILSLKLARVSLYGITRSTQLFRIINGNVVPVPTRSNYFNPGLHGVIMLVLHDIAAVAASDYQAHYIHTDGFILPASNLPLLADYALRNYGLHITARSSVGEAHIRGLGRYRVGDLRSVPYLLPSDEAPYEFTPWLPPSLPELRTRFRALLQYPSIPPNPL